MAIPKNIKKLLKKGGYLAGKDKGKPVKLTNSKRGGIAVGAKHGPEGGIKGEVGTEKKPIEFEGEEIIITAPAVKDNTRREFEGQQLTNREILSKINQSGGGVSFADGGEVPGKIRYDKKKTYKVGGKTMTAQQVVEYCGCGCEHAAEEMAEGGNVDEWTDLSFVKPSGITTQETSAFGNPDKLILLYNGKKIARFYYNMRGYNPDFFLKNKENVHLGFGGDRSKIYQLNTFKKALKDGFVFIKHYDKLAEGGSVSFSDKVTAIAKKLKGQPVPAEYRKQYGKTYTAATAKQAATKIAGAMVRDEKMAAGGLVSRQDALALIKKINPLPPALATYKNEDPGYLLSYIQDQATGFTEGRERVSYPPAYESIVRIVGKDTVLACVQALDNYEKEMLIKYWKGRIVPKELRDVVKQTLEDGGTTSEFFLPESDETLDGLRDWKNKVAISQLNVNVLSVIFNNNEDFETAKAFFESEKSNFSPFYYNDEFHSIDFEVKGQQDADTTEQQLSDELNNAGIANYRFESSHEDNMKKGGNIAKKEKFRAYTMLPADEDGRIKTSGKPTQFYIGWNGNSYVLWHYEHRLLDTFVIFENDEELKKAIDKVRYSAPGFVNYGLHANQKFYKEYLPQSQKFEYAKGGQINPDEIKADLALGGLLDHRARDYKLLKATVDFPAFDFEKGGQIITTQLKDCLISIIKLIKDVCYQASENSYKAYLRQFTSGFSFENEIQEMQNLINKSPEISIPLKEILIKILTLIESVSDQASESIIRAYRKQFTSGFNFESEIQEIQTQINRSSEVPELWKEILIKILTLIETVSDQASESIIRAYRRTFNGTFSIDEEADKLIQEIQTKKFSGGGQLQNINAAGIDNLAVSLRKKYLHE